MSKLTELVEPAAVPLPMVPIRKPTPVSPRAMSRASPSKMFKLRTVLRNSSSTVLLSTAHSLQGHASPRHGMLFYRSTQSIRPRIVSEPLRCVVTGVTPAHEPKRTGWPALRSPTSTGRARIDLVALADRQRHRQVH